MTFTLKCLLVACVLVAFQNARSELIAHWAFDEAKGTTTTNLATGTFGILTNALWVPGRVGSSALAFSNYNFHISAVKLFDQEALRRLGQGPFTFCWWQKGSGDAFSFGNTNKDGDAYEVFFDGQLWLTVHRPATNEVWITNYQRYNQAWIHIALLWNGVTRKVYVDGLLRDSLPTTQGLPMVSTDLLIGSKGDRIGFAALDDFRIYNNALSADDISKLIAEVTPRVTIGRRSAEVLYFGWDIVGPEAYRLESSPMNGVASVWTPIPSIPMKSGMTNTIPIPAPQQNSIYRLRQL